MNVGNRHGYSIINPNIERDPTCYGNINTSAGIRKGLPKEVTFGVGFEDYIGVCLEESRKRRYNKRDSCG